MYRIVLYSNFKDIKIFNDKNKIIFFRPKRNIFKPILIPNVKYTTNGNNSITNVSFKKASYKLLDDFMRGKGLRNYIIKDLPIKVDADETNKACTYKIRGVIFVNPTFFAKLNGVEKYVIINHELAHQVFEDESDCDAYAVIKGIGYGFSPYMLYKALKNTLDLHNRFKNKRITNDYDNLKNFQDGQTN